MVNTSETKNEKLKNNEATVQVMKQPKTFAQQVDFYRAIAAHYRDIVCPGGWLVFEIGCAQRADVMEICRQNGWQQVQARKDYGGNDRVVYAQRVE